MEILKTKGLKLFIVTGIISLGIILGLVYCEYSKESENFKGTWVKMENYNKVYIQ